MADEFDRANVTPQTGDATASAERMVEVTQDDLPLHCPMDGQALWDSHPRVYLPIEDTGEATCPYCGIRYRLRK